MKLWLVRHAQTLIAPGICYGASDIAANALATAAAARALAAALPTDLPLLCSPRKRCVQLAQAVLALRPDLRYNCDARLAEMDFGHWECRAWDAIGEPELTQWTADFGNYACGGAESVNAFLGRVAGAWDEAQAQGGDLAWITHGGVMRAARLLHQGLRQLELAQSWPTECMAFGQWIVIE